MYAKLLTKHEKISQEKIKVAIKEENERELAPKRFKIIEDALHAEEESSDEDDDSIVAEAPDYNDIAAQAPDYDTLNLQMLSDDAIFELPSALDLSGKHNLILLQQMPLEMGRSTGYGTMFMIQ